MQASNQDAGRGAWALYAGDGRYVEAVERGRGPVPVHRMGPRERALTWGRRGAIEACHLARRAGLMVWITPAEGVAA